MNPKIKKIIKGNRLLLVMSRNVQRLQVKYRKPVSGKNNVVINKGVSFNIKYDVVGDGNRIEIKEGAIIANLRIYIRGNNHSLTIGENCRYNGGSVWFEDNNCTAVIGRNTTIESAHLALTEPGKSIVIGEDCMFAYDIEFKTGDSHSILDNTTGKRVNYAKSIEVGNHVWIGARSTILKGVSIGNNCVVGTNSIVTKSIPDSSVVVGIPAKVVKENVNWSRERVYDQ